jgi:hypothetical protein
MMRPALVVAATLLFSSAVGAQLPRQLPDDNLAYPVLVDLGTTTATGFFVRSERHLFLVTASHVFFDRTRTTLKRPSAVTEALSTDPSEAAKNINKLDLVKLRKNGDLRASADGDVVVIRMAALAQPVGELEPVAVVSILSQPKGNIVAARLRTLARFSDVRVSNTVVVFGYPITIGLPASPQIDFSRPLLRSGIVAGINAPHKTIILDVPVNPGNSGGPVLQLPPDSAPGGALRIIGVVTEFVPILQDTIPPGPQKVATNSGYAVAASMDSVLDLIASFEAVQ